MAEDPSGQHEDSSDIVLVAENGDEFRVRLEVARDAQLLKDLTGGEVVPLRDFKSCTVRSISEWLNYPRRRTEWQRDWVGGNVELTRILTLSNYMHIEALLNWTFQRMPDEIRGKTPADISASFDLPVFDEEAETRRGNELIEEPDEDSSTEYGVAESGESFGSLYDEPEEESSSMEWGVTASGESFGTLFDD